MIPRRVIALCVSLSACVSIFLTTGGCSSDDEITDVLPEVIVPAAYAGNPDVYLVGTGDDSLELFVNGTPVTAEAGTNLYQIPITAGTMTIAARVANPFLGGAFFAYLSQVQAGLDTLAGDLNVLETNTDWVYTFDAPAGWETAGFDDNSWRTAHEIGGIGQIRQSPSFEAAAGNGIDTFSTAKYIWHNPTIYFRSPAFTSTAGEMTVKVGVKDLIVPGGEITVYLNGAAVISPEQITAQGMYTCTTQAAAGQNLIAIELTDTSKGDGAKFILEATLPDGSHFVSQDSWKCSDVLAQGWQNQGFDDAAWYSAGDMGDYIMGGWIGNSSFKRAWTHFTEHDTTLYICIDTLNLTTFQMDTIECNDVDTTLMTGTPTTAHWLFAPATVYFRYQFKAVIQ